LTGREERRLLRLRGWGRKGGIYGRATQGKAPGTAVQGKQVDAIGEMRRAAALYLASRECVSRDIAFLLLPPGHGRNCVGDLMVFTRGDVFMAGFAMTRQRPAAALSQMAGRIRDLGKSCRIIHAETPAHAVEQLERLIETAIEKGKTASDDN